MTVIDFSFPGQWTTTATSCIPHDSVFMPGPHVRKSEKGFFCRDNWLQIFQNDSKICQAEVTLTPLINKICKPCQGNRKLCVPTFRFLKSYEVPNKFALKFYVTWNLSLFFFACSVPNIQHGDITENVWQMILRLFTVTPPSYFVGVPSYFEALWYPHLYFDRESNT